MTLKHLKFSSYGNSCFGHGRLAFPTTLNYICVICNIIWLILNFLTLNRWFYAEKIYSIVCAVLFLIGSLLVVWWLIDTLPNRWWPYGTAGIFICEFLLNLYDAKILQ
ncbi:hypothetical protein WR25_16823 [Diploscapter pachys]|uniref:Uncharacterized protein n=1 Tax=Diploscapter pachys TaxID=2018661 RepID=A0A2A2L339_9BILA|nr:hypothetical protein WR25_16823 [Diploscapter pachys]